MARTIGDRVGAILSANDAVVKLFGYGTYQGDSVPPPEANFYGGDNPNPHILLDNGKSVYGFECWWGPEERIKAAIGNRTVEIVDIDAIRKGTKE